MSVKESEDSATAQEHSLPAKRLFKEECGFNCDTDDWEPTGSEDDFVTKKAVQVRIITFSKFDEHTDSLFKNFG